MLVNHDIHSASYHCVLNFPIFSGFRLSLLSASGLLLHLALVILVDIIQLPHLKSGFPVFTNGSSCSGNYMIEGSEGCHLKRQGEPLPSPPRGKDMSQAMGPLSWLHGYQA